MASHMSYCCVDGCNANVRENVSFFRCPKDPLRCQQWKGILGFTGEHKYANLTTEEAFNRIRICSVHFDDQSFTSSRKRLLKTAVPSKLLSQIDGPSSQKDLIVPDIDNVESCLNHSSQEDLIPDVVKIETFSNHSRQEGIIPDLVKIESFSSHSSQEDVIPDIVKIETFSNHNRQEDVQNLVKIETFSNYSSQEDVIPDLIKIETTSTSNIPTTSYYNASSGLSFKSDASTQSEIYQDFMEDASCQTALHLSENSPRKQGLKRKLLDLQNSVNSSRSNTKITLEDVLHFLDEHYPQEDTMLIKSQLLLLDKDPKGARYSNEFKQFALTLFRTI